MRLRLTLPALCAAAVSFLAANDGHAKVPDPRYSEVPAVLVGCPSGALLPSCPTRSEAPGGRALGFRVLLKDGNNAPLMNELVTLDFSQTSIRLLGDDRAGTTVDCAARTISRLTDLHGVAEFAPRFCGHSGGDDVLVSGEGVWLRLVPRARPISTATARPGFPTSRGWDGASCSTTPTRRATSTPVPPAPRAARPLPTSRSSPPSS